MLGNAMVVAIGAAAVVMACAGRQASTGPGGDDRRRMRDLSVGELRDLCEASSRLALETSTAEERHRYRCHLVAAHAGTFATEAGEPEVVCRGAYDACLAGPPAPSPLTPDCTQATRAAEVFAEVAVGDVRTCQADMSRAVRAAAAGDPCAFLRGARGLADVPVEEHAAVVATRVGLLEAAMAPLYGSPACVRMGAGRPVVAQPPTSRPAR